MPVTAVIAPPGFGKTTFVSSYIESLSNISLWYCVDEGDADLASFFHYFSQGIIDITMPRGIPIPHYQATDALNIKEFSRRYFSCLYQRLEQPFFIIFDDFHECQSQQWADVVSVAIDELPAACRVILVSRETLPAELARLKLNQKIHTIGEDDLRFNEQELIKLASINDIPSMSIEKRKQIQATMNGWAAGLTLLFSNRDCSTQGVLLAVDIKHDLYNYFANEVLRNIESEVHDVLYRSCFLKDISVAHAIKLSANNAAADILQNLHARNYFTYRVSDTDTDTVYRFHPLFKSFLMAQSKKKLSAKRLLETQQKSFEILEHEGTIAEAAGLLIAASNWTQLTHFTIQYAQKLVASNRTQTLLKWLQHIPLTMIERSGWLLFWRGICILSVRPQLARQDFITAFNLFSNEADATGKCLSLSGVIDCFIHERDDFTPLDQWIFHVDQLEETVLTQVSPHAVARLSISMFSALLHRAPDHPQLVNWLDRVQKIPSNVLPTFLDIKRKTYVILHYLWQGDFRSAEINHALLVNKLENNHDPITNIVSHIIHSCVLWSSIGDCQSALAVAKKGLEEAANYGVSLANIGLLSHGAAAALMMHNSKEAGELLHIAADYEDDTRRTHLVFYYMLHAVHSFQTSDVEAAFHHAQTALRYASQIGIPFFNASSHGLLAQLYFIKGDVLKAKKQSAIANSIALKVNDKFNQFNAFLFDAILVWSEGQHASALSLIRSALKLGGENKLLPGLWVCNEALSQMLVEAIRHGVEAPYAYKIIDKRHLMPKNPPYDIEEWSWPINIYTLGRFEIHINGQPLKLLGRSRPKVFALLKTLIAFGGENVREELISETIWPDSEGDAAHQLFNTTLFRLRKLFGQNEAIINREGQLSLNRDICWIDTWALNASADKLIWLVNKGNASDDGNHEMEQIFQCYKQVSNYYHGDFFQSEETLPVVIQQRLRKRKKWAHALYTVVDYWSKNELFEQAEAGLETLLAGNSLEEKAYRLLMDLYIVRGRYSEAAMVYNNCEKALKTGLNVSPSIATKRVFSKLEKLNT